MELVNYFFNVIFAFVNQAMNNSFLNSYVLFIFILGTIFISFRIVRCFTWR